MANTIKVEIVSAEEEVWSGEGTMVFAPAEMSEIEEHTSNSSHTVISYAVFCLKKKKKRKNKKKDKNKKHKV